MPSPLGKVDLPKAKTDEVFVCRQLLSNTL